MNVNLIISGTIAAGLHLLLLGIPPGAPIEASDGAAPEDDPLPIFIPPIEPLPPIDEAPEIPADQPAAPLVPQAAEIPSFFSNADFPIIRPPAPKIDGPPVDLINANWRPNASGGTSQMTVFMLKELQNNPRALFRHAPQPPPDFNDPNATVTVEFIVGPDGQVINAQVVDSTHRLLDDACLRAVRRWRFEAGLRNGVPVPFRVQQTFVFNGRE